ncbi:MAG: hypothetical protein IJG38_03785 [Thermoguttaceae bacterium]|nr:hypothetical protein [Thermoguttaceae bacterium]
MTIEQMLHDPLIVATIITVIVGFVLLFAFWVIDKIKWQREFKKFEKNFLDVVVAQDLYEKRLIEHGIKIKELYSMLSLAKLEIDMLNQRTNTNEK